jgi:hypothetical protein
MFLIEINCKTDPKMITGTIKKKCRIVEKE